MRISSLLGCLTVAAVLLSPHAQAYTLFGGPDCGKWVNTPSAQYKTWLMGFMSGQNAQHVGYRDVIKDPYFQAKDPLDQVSSAEQLFLWMDNYCRANPLKTVADGGVALFAELVAKRNAAMK